MANGSNNFSVVFIFGGHEIIIALNSFRTIIN